MIQRYGSRLVVLGPLLAGALALAQQPTANKPGPLDGNFQSAVAAYDSGRFVEAAALLEKLLPQAPASFEVHELLGLTYAAQSQNAKAIDQLQNAVRLKPASAAARTNLATALVHAGKPQEAEEQCSKALALDPHDYDANHNLAELLVSSGRVGEAVPLFEQAQRLHPDAYDNSYDLALAYLLTGKPEQARQQVVALLSRQDTGELHSVLGRVNEKEGKFIEAANEFATAAHLDPSEDNLFVWGSELLLHRTYEPAIEVFEQGAQRYPKSPRLLMGLGMALYSHGEYEKSIQSLLAAADLDPADPRCYLFLSKAYLSSPGQAEDVIKRFRRYAQLEPGNARALYYYAVSLWKGGRLENPNVDYGAVESLLEKSIALDGSLADAHLQLGILYSEQREYAKSFPEYERALQLDQDLPNAHFRLGQYYVHVGEKDKAQNEFEIYKKLQAEHQSQLDREKAEVQQFVVTADSAAQAKP